MNEERPKLPFEKAVEESAEGVGKVTDFLDKAPPAIADTVAVRTASFDVVNKNPTAINTLLGALCQRHRMDDEDKLATSRWLSNSRRSLPARAPKPARPAGEPSRANDPARQPEPPRYFG